MAKTSTKKAPPAKKTSKPVAKKASAPKLAVKSTMPASKSSKRSKSVSRKVKAANLVLPGSQSTPAPMARRPMQKATNAPIPAAPVTTGTKPRKNQAGLNSRDLEHFRDLLLAKRRELVGDMSSMEREALRSSAGSNLSNLPLHMADMGTDNYEQEFTLGLVEKDRNLLREINAALAKIQNGTYGLCEGTGKPISKVRLEAQPWARHSIEYARQMEKGRMR